MHAVSNQPDRSCPDCRMPLERHGETWHCSEHGDFFSYGPRRMMRVAATAVGKTRLMPWQTLDDRTSDPSPLPAAAPTTE
jgi:hypothetical protein